MSGPPHECPQGAAPDPRQLGYPERLVLWTVRRWFEDGQTSTAVEGAIFRACGIAYTEAALEGFAGLVEVLVAAGRRRLVVHGPGRGDVSADEMSILSLIGAAQAGDRDHVEASVRWLVPATHGQPLRDHAMALAIALHRCGLVVPRQAGPLTPRFAGDENEPPKSVCYRRNR